MATILVIDDEQLICDLLRDALGRQGHEVFTATTGAHGLEIFRLQHPALTILDLRMPKMDGIQVLTQLRQIDPHAKVIMLSSEGSGTLEVHARQLGITDFFRKSISLKQLAATTKRVTERTRAAFGNGPSRTLDGRQYSVLVVEDDDLVRRLVAEFLQSRGYTVVSVADGSAAMSQIERQAPDLIVLDLYLPDMNGIEILRALHRQAFTGAVITLTGSQDEALLKETLRLGSVDIIGKPVELSHLSLAIEVGLPLKGL